MNKRLKQILSIFLGMLLLGAGYIPAAANFSAPAKIIPTITKPIHTQIRSWESKNIIQVKFKEGTTYRLRGNQLVTLGRDNLSGIKSALSAFPVQKIERVFTQPEDEISAEKLTIESSTNEQMPDLNLWYRFTVADSTKTEALIDQLNALPDVEIAYPALLPSPLPDDTRGTLQPANLFTLPEPPTANYMAQQGYLNPAPGGINAKYAWTLPGGDGRNVTIVDVEYSFNNTHEDLPTIPVIAGQMYNGFGNDHGTAVAGELMSKNNGIGVKGIAYGATEKFSSACSDSSCSSYNPANAINIGRTHTVAGDAILIEQQTPVCGLSDYGPLEWDQSVFDAIKLATSAGRNVIEAAGNGSVNLDAAGCGGKFNTSVRDSGAIIVGAGSPPTYPQVDRSRLYFSTYGSRVNVQGWGEDVVTTGYGDLYSGSGANQYYTSYFSGTSSASPIITGAVALLSSIAQQRGAAVTPAWIRSTLATTGSPQQSASGYPATQHIGQRPNLKNAIAKIPVVGFNSQFTSNANGWSTVKGAWTVNATLGAYTTSGAPNSVVHSASHVNNYSTLTYEVRLKRTICTSCANQLIIRGTPASVPANGTWKNGYIFQYQNRSAGNASQGAWSIQKEKNGVQTTLKNWTATPYLVQFGWNTLKVTAKGTALKFYINGHLVWSGTDTALTAGQVGLGMYQGNSAANMGILNVDWAKLTPSVAP